TLREYARYLATEAQHDEAPWYLASWRFWEAFPALLDDFEVPSWLGDDWLAQVDEAVRPTLIWMFIGPPRTGSWLHLDVAHSSAWNAQITGRKRWILFPPGQDDCLYDGRVNAFAPDLARFPLFAKARAVVADVEPGDVIFTPSAWWHQTLNLETGIALTGNFANAWNGEQVSAWLDAHPLALAAQGLGGLAEAFRQRLRRAR
ncbi:MAG: hypothetical protein EB084_25760, partial [Proteobacteria bacterium]|nr:hypothetical protein [Pseudomonadota bacterium]